MKNTPSSLASASDGTRPAFWASVIAAITNSARGCSDSSSSAGRVRGEVQPQHVSKDHRPQPTLGGDHMSNQLRQHRRQVIGLGLREVEFGDDPGLFVSFQLDQRRVPWSGSESRTCPRTTPAALAIALTSAPASPHRPISASAASNSRARVSNRRTSRTPPTGNPASVMAFGGPMEARYLVHWRPSMTTVNDFAGRLAHAHVEGGILLVRSAAGATATAPDLTRPRVLCARVILGGWAA